MNRYRLLSTFSAGLLISSAFIPSASAFPPLAALQFSPYLDDSSYPQRSQQSSRNPTAPSPSARPDMNTPLPPLQLTPPRSTAALDGAQTLRMSDEDRRPSSAPARLMTYPHRAATTYQSPTYPMPAPIPATPITPQMVPVALPPIPAQPQPQPQAIAPLAAPNVAAQPRPEYTSYSTLETNQGLRPIPPSTGALPQDPSLDTPLPPALPNGVIPPIVAPVITDADQAAHTAALPPQPPVTETSKTITVVGSQGLPEESRQILEKVPSNLDSEQRPRGGNITLERIDPEIQGILDAPIGEEDEVITHESGGVSIAVRQPKFNADYELEKAYNSLTAGETTVAIEIYKQILKNDPGNQDALFGLAATYHRVGELDIARPLYGKLLTINPRHKEALNNFLAMVAEESPEEALLRLQELELQNPDFSPIPAQMALLYEQLGDHESARRSMAKAMMLSPENLIYKYNMAVMLDNNDYSEEAANLYRQLLRAADQGETLPADTDEIQERLTFLRSNRT